MEEENKDEGAVYPIKIFLKEAPEKHRNAMMDNFAQILQRLPTIGASTSYTNSSGATPLEVHDKFDIPIFEGQINAYVIDIWLNFLEGYFSVHNFFDREKIIFAILKATPMSKIGGKPTVSKRTKGNLLCSRPHPLGIHSKMASRNNITPWGAMRTSTSNGPCYGSKGIKMCTN